MTKRSSEHAATLAGAWLNVDGFPDDIWRLLLQLYVPETPRDWLRLVTTSKRLAALCHDALLRWMHRHTRPMQWGEFLASRPPGPRVAALLGDLTTEREYYARDWRFALRSALARYANTQQALNDALIDLNMLTEEGCHYDAVSLARLLSPWIVAFSPVRPKNRPVFPAFWAAFREHFMVHIDTCSS